MASNKEVAVKKRSAIDKSNRNMFIVVACSSAVLGVAIVGSVFLMQKMLFQDKVIKEKQATSKTVAANGRTIVGLQSKIKDLQNNSALKSVELPWENDTLRVVGDALPIPEAGDAAKLVSSLNERLLNVPQVVKESLNIEASGEDEVSGVTYFTFSVSGGLSEIQEVLLQLEKSIRQMDIISMSVGYDENDSKILTVSAQTYWTDGVIVPETLPTKEVRP